ncbi:MAG: HAMP domain-containing sensor histidine kinase [Pseudomonas sp.]|uniref:sensor histidine kinase n=1 Tax=Pseudomonas sp. TaxID=306 RepID=UPI0030F20C7B
MRSLFWRIFASFWLAIVLVAGLSMVMGRVLNQDAWILSQHPALQGVPEQWASIYESKGQQAAQEYLQQRKRDFRIDTQVLDDSGNAIIQGTFPPRAAAFEKRQHDDPRRLPWRRLTTEYTSPSSGDTYLFIYRIPHPELDDWHRGSLFLPVSALGIAFLVLTALSLLLTLSITRPLGQLRGAVHDLGQAAYQQHTLARLSTRRDEFGVLAGDFNRMGERLQDLISSQRQLLRDVSHELRSPLARLRIALALAERAEPEERVKLWPRLERECDRLEALISEILALARMDANLGAAQAVDITALFASRQQEAELNEPEQRIVVAVEPALSLLGWPDMLERALDNLVRNALRFNPAGQAIELRAEQTDGRVRLSVRDHGPGVLPEHLARLGEPFFRAPEQTAPGHGLGLAIARRAAERHGGILELANHAQGGFVASLVLPAAPQTGKPH